MCIGIPYLELVLSKTPLITLSGAKIATVGTFSLLAKNCSYDMLVSFFLIVYLGLILGVNDDNVSHIVILPVSDPHIICL